MASSLFHKLLRDHHSPVKLISALNKPKSPPFQIPSLSHLLREPLETLAPNHCNPNFVQFQTRDLITRHLVPIFPSSPFGYCLNPVSSAGSVPDCAGVSGDDGKMMWADSVKKKRKKKMNKHKLKKLRKRLRRKT